MPSKWLCARGQGARVPVEENHGPERQINPPPSYSVHIIKTFIVLKRKKKKIEVPIVAQRVTNPTRIHENSGLIPVLTQWFKDPVLP